jgi:Beta-galactosidase
LLARLLLALLACATAGPAAAGWDRYETILWHDNGPAQREGARRLGVTAIRILGVREAVSDSMGAELARRAAPPRQAGLGLYVENIATDFYAAYHRWRPDRTLTWQFDLARAGFAANRADPAAVVRQPGLSDPAALSAVAHRLRAHVRALGAAPLFYCLGDETGIADLTAAWDFDRSDASLAAMRAWLRGQYGSLAALNREWGTGFAEWDTVRPLSTDAALAVRDGNFAAWADFKAWMDVAFARAVRAGVDAVHAADPAARAGLEGAQAPGWGGYDYTRLAGAVDVMEVTASEGAQDIAQAMNPALVTLTTAATGDPRPLWRAVLAGGRGVILWDPDGAFVAADGSPGPQGLALSGFLADMRGPLGTRLLAAAPHRDQVAILYSPASFRTQWLLDRQTDAAAGRDWASRTSETELDDNAWRAATRGAADALAHLSLQPRWLSPEMLAGGALRDGIRALILPHALALSDDEVVAIHAFAAAGGTVLADIPPGQFDGHSRRRTALPLNDATLLPGTLLPGLPRAALAARLAAAGVVADFALTRPDGTPARDATTRVLHEAGATILAVLRDDGATEPVVLTLPQPRWVRDLRHATATQLTTRLQLPPATPTLLSLSATP